MRTGTVASRAVAYLAASTILALAACGGGSPAKGPSSGELTNASLTKVSFIGVQEQGATGYAAAVVQGAFTAQGLDFSPT